MKANKTDAWSCAPSFAEEARAQGFRRPSMMWVEDADDDVERHFRREVYRQAHAQRTRIRSQKAAQAPRTATTRKATPPRARRSAAPTGGKEGGGGDSGDGGSGDGEPPHGLPSLLTLHDLAALLRCSIYTLYTYSSKHPGRLPPAIYLPGVRGPRYTSGSVCDWITAHAARGRTEGGA